MSIEDLLIAHGIISWLLPDELEALVGLLEKWPAPASAQCIVPLKELRQVVAAEFGEGCRAARQHDAWILWVDVPPPSGGP